MELIQKHNWNYKYVCMEKCCDEKPTHFQYIKIQGLEIVICLCPKHAEAWNYKFWGDKNGV